MLQRWLSGGLHPHRGLANTLRFGSIKGKSHAARKVQPVEGGVTRKEGTGTNSQVVQPACYGIADICRGGGREPLAHPHEIPSRNDKEPVRAELRFAHRVELGRIHYVIGEVVAMKNLLQGGHIASRSSHPIE